MSTTPYSNVIPLFPREEELPTEPEITESDLIAVKFPRRNKRDTLEKNDAAIAEGFTVSKAYITETVIMGREDWEEFTSSLLADREWIAGKGGACSLWNDGGREYLALKEWEQEEWKKQAYTFVLEVIGPERTLYIDPSGHNYARYTGVLYQPGDTEAWEEKEAAKKAEVKRQFQEAARLKEEDRQAKIARGTVLFNARPLWAKAAIIAQSEEDKSDPQSDYYGSSTARTVFLAWSKSTRDNFAEMRKAAATFPPTIHLGPGKDEFTARVYIETDFYENGRYYHKGDYSPWHHELDKVYEGGLKFQTQEEINTFLATAPQPGEMRCGETLVSFAWQVGKSSLEQRERWSGGHGLYLGKDRYAGWQVRKIPLSEYSVSSVCLALGSSVRE